VGTIVYMGGLDVLVQSLGAVEDGEAEEPWGMLPDRTLAYLVLR
jgi:hypothetical protein